MTQYTDPFNGEVREINTDVEAKDALVRLKKCEEILKASMDIIKSKLVEELHRNSGRPIEFADGSRVSLVKRAAQRTIEKGDWLKAVKGDQDKADLAMKVDVPKAEKLLQGWVEEKENVDPSLFKNAVKATYTTEYPRFEKA